MGVNMLWTHSKFMKLESDKIPLLDPFPLPQQFSHRLETALASGKLTKKEKQTYITEVDSCMMRFKRYPDRDDYICVIRAVISKYRFVKLNSRNPYVSFLFVLVFTNFFSYYSILFFLRMC